MTLRLDWKICSTGSGPGIDFVTFTCSVRGLELVQIVCNGDHWFQSSDAPDVEFDSERELIHHIAKSRTKQGEIVRLTKILEDHGIDPERGVRDEQMPIRIATAEASSPC